jgi:hypothetical protein
MIFFRNDEEKEFWKQVYIAYVSASNSISVTEARKWADDAVESLRARNR